MRPKRGEWVSTPNGIGQITLTGRRSALVELEDGDGKHVVEFLFSDIVLVHQPNMACQETQLERS
jgi:hypothetical protein